MILTKEELSENIVIGNIVVDLDNSTMNGTGIVLDSGILIMPESSYPLYFYPNTKIIAVSIYKARGEEKELFRTRIKELMEDEKPLSELEKLSRGFH